MDHSSAIKNLTAERYMLGELNELEHDAYEEHFFSCPTCAAEVKAVSDFMESAKHAIITEKQAEPRVYVAKPVNQGSWLNWKSLAPLAACLLMAAFTGYQNSVIIPQLSRAASVQVIPPDDDANLAVLQSAHGNEGSEFPSSKPLRLRFMITQPASRADIVTESGATKYSLDISKEKPGNPVNLLVRPGALDPGKYFVVVHRVAIDGRQAGPEVDRFPLVIVK